MHIWNVGLPKLHKKMAFKNLDEVYYLMKFIILHHFNVPLFLESWLLIKQISFAKNKYKKKRT